jgi:hypothetical protein
MRDAVVNRSRQHDDKHAVENVRPNTKVPTVWNVCYFFPFSQAVSMDRMMPADHPMAARPPKSDHDLEAEAEEALEAARAMPAGTAKSDAMKRAGLLRQAAEAGISPPRRGRPPK